MPIRGPFFCARSMLVRPYDGDVYHWVFVIAVQVSASNIRSQIPLCARRLKRRCMSFQSRTDPAGPPRHPGAVLPQHGLDKQPVVVRPRPDMPGPGPGNNSISLPLAARSVRIAASVSSSHQATSYESLKSILGKLLIEESLLANRKTWVSRLLHVRQHYIR